jgi:hypothetical protein
MTLASGQLNKSDQLEVELHRPADLPAFILVKWPAAPSVARPDNFTVGGRGLPRPGRCPRQPEPDAG